MIDVLVWNKYTRVVMQLAERLNISPEKALHLFYNSKVALNSVFQEFILLYIQSTFQPLPFGLFCRQ